MRTASLTTLTLLACGLAFAGRAENALYTGGNLDGISPQANVVLDLSGDKVMKIRAGRTDISVPYARVTKTDVSAADAAASPVSVKGKKGSKSSEPTQNLTLEYQNAQGEAKTMTLQLTRPAASSVVAAVHKHSPVAKVATKVKPAKADKKAVAQKEVTPKEVAPKEVAQKDKDKPQKVAKKSKKEKAAEQQEVAKNEAADKDAAKKDAGWWGDSYWKTTRNQAKWEEKNGPAAQ